MIIFTSLLKVVMVKVLWYMTQVSCGLHIHTSFTLVLDLAYDHVSVFSMSYNALIYRFKLHKLNHDVLPRWSHLLSNTCLKMYFYMHLKPFGPTKMESISILWAFYLSHSFDKCDTYSIHISQLRFKFYKH